MSDDYEDPEAAELRAEDRQARRAFIRATRCQCGDDLPGTCPGPANCPYNQPEEEEVLAICQKFDNSINPETEK